MKAIYLIIILPMMLFASLCSAQSDKNAKLIEGTWQLDSMYIGGQQLPEQLLRKVYEKMNESKQYTTYYFGEDGKYVNATKTKTIEGEWELTKSGDTLRLAAVLLDVGIDTETIYSRLYLEEFDSFRFQSYVFDNMKITDNGVAYIYVDEAMQQKFALTREQASNTVGLLGEIKGSIIWLAFIDYEGTIRVRLRSRYVEINKLAEKYHGGGHACASGATVYSREEMEALLRDADELIRDYKANNFYL